MQSNFYVKQIIKKLIPIYTPKHPTSHYYNAYKCICVYSITGTESNKGSVNPEDVKHKQTSQQLNCPTKIMFLHAEDLTHMAI